MKRSEIIMVIGALHKLTQVYRINDIDSACPLCEVNAQILSIRSEIAFEYDDCQACPWTFLEGLPLYRGGILPCDGKFVMREEGNTLRDYYSNFVRINRWIHKLIYILMETSAKEADDEIESF